jgi:hypothetical protein
MTVTKNIPSYIKIGSYRAIVKYEGQRPTCRLCDGETHFSNTCPRTRRNRETVVEKPDADKDKEQETDPKDQPTKDTETFEENAITSSEGNMKKSPSGENDNIGINSETIEDTQTQNPTCSLEIAPEQIPAKSPKKRKLTTTPVFSSEEFSPLNSTPTIIPETQHFYPLPPDNSLDPDGPNHGAAESMETDDGQKIPDPTSQNLTGLGKV